MVPRCIKFIYDPQHCTDTTNKTAAVIERDQCN